MNGSRDQLFTGTALAGDEYAAGLRRDRLDHVKDFAHLRALADDIVEAGQAAKLAPEIPRFFLPLQTLRYLADGAAKLVDQFVVFDNVAIGAGIDGGNGRFHGRNAGNQQEGALRRDLLGKVKEVHAAFAGHADVGHDNVENLRFQFALGGGDVVGDLDAMTFLAKGDLQEFANGTLVVDHENVHRVLARSFGGCFCRLHNLQAILGSSIINSAPRSFSEMTLMRPLCACTI